MNKIKAYLKITKILRHSLINEKKTADKKTAYIKDLFQALKFIQRELVSERRKKNAKPESLRNWKKRYYKNEKSSSFSMSVTSDFSDNYRDFLQSKNILMVDFAKILNVSNSWIYICFRRLRVNVDLYYKLILFFEFIADMDPLPNYNKKIRDEQTLKTLENLKNNFAKYIETKSPTFSKNSLRNDIREINEQNMLKK